MGINGMGSDNGKYGMGAAQWDVVGNDGAQWDVMSRDPTMENDRMGQGSALRFGHRSNQQSFNKWWRRRCLIASPRRAISPSENGIVFGFEPVWHRLVCRERSRVVRPRGDLRDRSPLGWDMDIIRFVSMPSEAWWDAAGYGQIKAGNAPQKNRACRAEM